MSDAQSYYDGLLSQGYTPDQATQYTQQYYPDFQPVAPQVAPVAQFEVDQSQVQSIAQTHGVDPTQLVDTARYYDANQDGVLQPQELTATAQAMTNTAAPMAPAAMPMPAMQAPMPGMAAAPAGMPMPGMGGAPAGMPMPGMGGAPAGMPAPMPGMNMAAAPASSGEVNSLGWAAVGCIAVSMILAGMGIFGGSWLTSDLEDGSSANFGLTSIHFDCTDIMNETEKQACAVQFWTLTQEDMNATPPADIPVKNSGDISTYCSNVETFSMGTLQALATLTGGEVPQEAKNNITAAYNECMETDSAGGTGSLMLWIGTTVALLTTVLMVFNMLGMSVIPGDTQKISMIAGFVTAVLIGLGVLLWYMGLPDSGDASAGINVWLTLIGAVTAATSGLLIKMYGRSSN